MRSPCPVRGRLRATSSGLSAPVCCHATHWCRRSFVTTLACGDELSYTVDVLFPEDRELLFYGPVPRCTTFVTGSLMGLPGITHQATPSLARSLSRPASPGRLSLPPELTSLEQPTRHIPSAIKPASPSPGASRRRAGGLTAWLISATSIRSTYPYSAGSPPNTEHERYQETEPIGDRTESFSRREIGIGCWKL